MKSLKIVTIILTTLIFGSASNLFAAQGEPVTGFLIKMAVVDEMKTGGATSIVINPAMGNGQYKYILTGINESGAATGKAYLQDETGDCPPSCEYSPASLRNGSWIEQSSVASYTNAYTASFPTAINKITICNSTLEKVVNRGYTHMEVTITGGQVKVIPLKDNGRTNLFSTIIEGCNTMSFINGVEK